MNAETPSNAKPKSKGGRPKNPLDFSKLMEHPDFQAFTSKLTQDAASAAVLAMGGVEGARVEMPVTAAPPGSPEWASTLAIAIAQAADPRRKPLDPRIIEQRQRARARMTSLIEHYRHVVDELLAKGDNASAQANTPEYELTREVFLEEQLVQPTYIGADRVIRRQKIGWPKVPNQAMVPVNEPAREIYAAYLESVGGVVKEGKTPERVDSRNLQVFQDGKLQSIPQARNARNANSGSLSLRGHAIPGAVVETPVLGTVHPPARQVA